jgi:hypothetical protein
MVFPSQLRYSTIIASTSPIGLQPALPKVFHDFDQYIATLPPWEQNVLSGVHLFTTQDEIVDHILSGVHLFTTQDEIVDHI